MVSVCRSYLKFILPSLLIVLIDTCEEKKTYNKFNLPVIIDLGEVAYCLKQAFYLLYDKGVAPVETLPLLTFKL